MKIAVDIDDVLNEWMEEFLGWYNRRYSANWTYEDVVEYYWPAWMGVSVNQAIDDVHLFQEDDRFRKLPVASGATQAIAELASRHELYAVTGRQNVTREITRVWLNEHFPGVFKAIEHINWYARDGQPTLTKGEVCKKLGCEILIDDDTRHVDSILEHGIKLVVFNKPWNGYHRLPDSILRADSWPEILEKINQLVAV